MGKDGEYDHRMVEVIGRFLRYDYGNERLKSKRYKLLRGKEVKELRGGHIV